MYKMQIQNECHGMFMISLITLISMVMELCLYWPRVSKVRPCLISLEGASLLSYLHKIYID